MQAGQIEDILRLDHQIFGFLPEAYDLSKLVDIEPIVGPVSWLRYHKGGLRGFVVFLPLSQNMRFKVLAGQAKGIGDLDFTEFHKPNLPVVGLFGEVVATIKACPAGTRFLCAKFAKEVTEEFPDLDLFATPVTQDGLDFQRKLAFEPLFGNGLHQVFMRPSVACTDCAAE